MTSLGDEGEGWTGLSFILISSLEEDDEEEEEDEDDDDEDNVGGTDEVDRDVVFFILS